MFYFMTQILLMVLCGQTCGRRPLRQRERKPAAATKIANPSD